VGATGIEEEEEEEEKDCPVKRKIFTAKIKHFYFECYKKIKFVKGNYYAISKHVCDT
jgi:hypothetical protein